MTELKRAVIDRRCPPKEQVENFSLQNQRAACVEYCARNQIEVNEVFVDEGESAKTTARPQFQRMLVYCKQQRGRVTHVVVLSVCRFSRANADYFVVRGMLRKVGVTLRAVREPIDDTSVGQLMEGFFSARAVRQRPKSRPDEGRDAERASTGPLDPPTAARLHQGFPERSEYGSGPSQGGIDPFGF